MSKRPLSNLSLDTENTPSQQRVDLVEVHFSSISRKEYVLEDLSLASAYDGGNMAVAVAVNCAFFVTVATTSEGDNSSAGLEVDGISFVVGRDLVLLAEKTSFERRF